MRQIIIKIRTLNIIKFCLLSNHLREHLQERLLIKITIHELKKSKKFLKYL